MRLLFVADGRSPIALNWIDYFLEQGHEVHLVSTFPCVADDRLASFQIIPVAFSSARPARPGMGEEAARRRGLWGGSAVRLRTAIRQWFGPLTLPRAASRLRGIIQRLQPDLVHAMRIPYEGMLAALAQPDAPLLVSVWGNDFSLHASSTPWMSRLTRRTLQQANALHADCWRDVRLARDWGFPASRMSAVLPGAGGIQPGCFYPGPVVPGSEEAALRDLTIINPRGIRAYVRTDLFFQSIPFVLAQQPEACFLCPAMAAETQAQRWVQELGIAANVELLSIQTRPQMADLFRRSRVAVSPSTHDGTPNTLLEAMACGCLPVAGDIESLREWIIPGFNGLLVELDRPESLAQAILLALENQDLYQRSQVYNARQIAERATYQNVMKQAEELYTALACSSS